MHPVISPKKLIEVALPLDAINAEGLRRKRKSPDGYPTTFHKWWAPRPIGIARAVLFAQLVHDPEDLWRVSNPGAMPNQQVRGHWTKARARLFGIIERIVLWENTTNEAILNEAREEIRAAWRETCELNKNHPRAMELFDPKKMPGLHDPFAGGGSIPLEAQRLGLDVLASDLNPVAVLVNKAMVEIPPKFASRGPVHPDARNSLRTWNGAAGLAEDVRRYSQWMRDEAFRRIGHNYPQIEITRATIKDRPDLKRYLGDKLNIIAWLWVRTVRSPNPAFSNVEVPLASTFVLSSKAGNEAYVQPIITRSEYHFAVRVGKPDSVAKAGTSAGKRKAFTCLMSNVPMGYEYIRQECKSKRSGLRLLAIRADAKGGGVYLSPTPEQEKIAQSITSGWYPEVPISHWPGRTNVVEYGLTHFGDLFTPRQSVALATFSDLITEARKRIHRDALVAGLADDKTSLNDGGVGARAYSEALTVYLAFALDRMADFGSVIATWRTKDNSMRSTFSEANLQMTWDFAEGSPFFGGASSCWTRAVEVVAKAIPFFPDCGSGKAVQQAAQTQAPPTGFVVSTDPPYYSNIGYADVSDFYYCLLRRHLRVVYPELLATISVPKADELVAQPYRHGGADKAEEFFLNGMMAAMRLIANSANCAIPIVIYYAVKESDTSAESGTSSTGWQTFLEAVVRSGLSITGTWPMSTESDNRQMGIEANALASSIILVCRPRKNDAGTISRRQFIRQLNEALPLALDAMTRESEGLHSPVAPVDLSQAIIGPGMAIYSRYDAVLEADGKPMTVKTALQLINRFLAEDDFDADTQFCLHWFGQNGWQFGKFGDADTLARAKGTSVDGVKHAGVIESAGGSVRLLKWAEYPDDWNPATDKRLPVWEALHQLIRAHRNEGDTGAGRVLAGVAGKAEAARQLAYRLYTLCERAGWAEDARAYNEVVTSWSGIEGAAVKDAKPAQQSMFDT